LWAPLINEYTLVEIICLSTASLNVLLVIGCAFAGAFLFIELSGFPISTPDARLKSTWLNRLVIGWSLTRIVWGCYQYAGAYRSTYISDIDTYPWSLAVAALYIICEILPCIFFYEAHTGHARNYERAKLELDDLKIPMPNQMIHNETDPIIVTPISPTFDWYVDTETVSSAGKPMQTVSASPSSWFLSSLVSLERPVPVRVEEKTWPAYIFDLARNSVESFFRREDASQKGSSENDL